MNRLTPRLIAFTDERLEWTIDQPYPTTPARIRHYLNEVADEVGLMIWGRFRPPKQVYAPLRVKFSSGDSNSTEGRNER